VRYCGITLEHSPDAPPPLEASGSAVATTAKLADVMANPCRKCKLQSNEDSWFVKFNADTRGPGQMAERWSVQTKKVAACLDKINRKSCSFFRGLNITLEKYIFSSLLLQPNFCCYLDRLV